jgi:hypothetical protein
LSPGAISGSRAPSGRLESILGLPNERVHDLCSGANLVDQRGRLPAEGKKFFEGPTPHRRHHLSTERVPLALGACRVGVPGVDEVVAEVRGVIVV